MPRKLCHSEEVVLRASCLCGKISYKTKWKTCTEIKKMVWNIFAGIEEKKEQNQLQIV